LEATTAAAAISQQSCKNLGRGETKRVFGEPSPKKLSLKS
jgi:hypothetical protein